MLHRHGVNEIPIGQFERVAIARALVVEPEVMLGAEVGAGVESQTSRQILALLRE